MSAVSLEAAALPPLRCFVIAPDGSQELGSLPAELPEQGFLWVACEREWLRGEQALVQAALQRWCGAGLVDLHLSDVLNAQLPSHYDDTSWYDLLVFRRLVAGAGLAGDGEGLPAPTATEAATRVRDAVDTQPVALVAFDRVLLSVHPADCAVREFFAQRLGTQVPTDARAAARVPQSPPDLMLRLVNHMVDSYLDLRRLLTRQLGVLQTALLDPRSRFADWGVLLSARTALHLLEDHCDDQHNAVQEWIDALAEWPMPEGAAARRERELLRVRSRDLLEHIERVLGHVRRLELSAETVVQLHFSAIGHRTSETMRTLTVLTAVFLPLNLITGFFGMNFEALPLIHSARGFWVAVAAMVLVFAGGLWLFRRKRYIS